jgi:pimeloyl-ACP methyl ester carboxylesterase
MRLYAARHPKDIAGIVFIDGSTPQQDRFFPGELKKEEDKYRVESELMKIATEIGVARAMGQCNEVQTGFEAYAAWIKADSCHPLQYTSIARETSAVPVSGDEAVHTGPFGAMPILIFSQDPNRSMDGLPASLSKQMSETWNGMQENLKKLSTHSRRIIANGSTHYIQVDRSDLVNREVAKFLDEVRTGTSSAQNGTTIRE